MNEVYEGLFVGDGSDCRHGGAEWAVVHACKHPCHQRAVGYSGNLNQGHPEYLVAPRGHELYLNLVDMDRKLKHRFTEPIVSETLDFVESHIESKNVLIHCNQGRSRSPALAMLYLAKRKGEIVNTSYDDARVAFSELYPPFSPGRGVDAYLRDYWGDLG